MLFRSPDDIRIVVDVSIPDGMTVEEVNAAADAASAARADQRKDD